MAIVQRIKDLNLPLDQLIVIGSGLLDAYGLREADDIDLVISDTLYRTLKATGRYVEGVKQDETYLVKDKLEIWLSWGSGVDFAYLQRDGVVIDGVTFVSPNFLMARKYARGSDKDIKDIKLLERYLNEQ
jgi:predicted nucleotidyltransferase